MSNRILSVAADDRLILFSCGHVITADFNENGITLKGTDRNSKKFVKKNHDKLEAAVRRSNAYSNRQTN